MLPIQPVDERPRCYVCGIVCRDGGPCLAWIAADATGLSAAIGPPSCVRTNIDPNLKG